jgi:hypothetical protein
MLVSVNTDGLTTDFTTGSVSMALALTDIPTLPYGDAPIAAVRLYTGQTGIYEYDDILDLRGNPFIGTSGSYGGGGGTGTHAPVTVVDTSTIDLTLSGQQISGIVLPGGIALDTLGSPTDITTLNAGTGTHGLAPKGHIVESPAKFWREDWQLAVPLVTGSSGGTPYATMWEPDAPLDSPSALDDNFDDGSLDGKWTSVGSVYTTSEEAYGWTITGFNYPLDYWQGIFQNVPDASWTISAKISLSDPNQHYCFGGLAILFTDIISIFDTWAIASFGSEAGLKMTGWVNQTTFATHYYEKAVDLLTGVYLRLRWDQPNLTMYFDASTDGIGYRQMFSGVMSKPVAIGLVFDNNDEPNTGNPARFIASWFRYQPTFVPLTDIPGGNRVGLYK